MSDYAFPPSFRATDADDNPLSGGTMRFYAAGTTTPKAVYSDAARTVTLGTQVSTNSTGVPVSGSNVPILIYYGTGNYKYALYDADGALVPGMEFDNIPGYVEPEAEVTTGLPEIPVDSKTTAYTVVTGDRGNLINANPTGGSFAITLPSAVTVGDDFLVGFRHNGTANAVTIVATGSQVIRFQGNRAAFSLVGQGETLWLVSDGSDWIACGYVPPFRKATDPYFIVLDRLTAPPANPDAGARYLINGTPTGAWSTLGFADEDIAEADGNGSWIKHTPAEGWLAFDVDEKVSLVFKNGAWENFQVDPGESTLKTLIVQDQSSSGTEGGTPTLDAWTNASLNTSVVNTITGASLAASEITLPAGRYRVKARKVFSTTGESRIRFKTADSSDVIILSESIHAGNIISTNSANAIVSVTAMLDGEFVITESTDFVLQYYVNVNQHTTGTQGLGVPSSISSTVETYATVVIEDLAAQQGPQGEQGTPGVDGIDAGYQYQWSTSTSGDPGTGKIRTNHATPASVTAIGIHQTDRNAAVLTTAIATWDDADNPTGNKARIKWHKETAPENFFEYLITGAGTDAGDYWTFPVSYVASAGTITNGNDVALQVSIFGNRGAAGATVPDISALDELSLTDFNRRLDRAIIYDASASQHKKFAVPMLAVDPTHPTFGATGDGVTNDTTAMQAALSANIGGFVFVPSGTYLCDDLTLTHKVHLRLAPDAIIKRRSVSAASHYMLSAGASCGGSTVQGGIWDGDRDTHNAAWLTYNSGDATLYPNGNLRWTGFYIALATVHFRDITFINQSHQAFWVTADDCCIENILIEDCGMDTVVQHCSNITMRTVKSLNTGNDDLPVYQHAHEWRNTPNSVFQNVDVIDFNPTAVGLESFPFAFVINRAFNSTYEDIGATNFAGVSPASTKKAGAGQISYASECTFRGLSSDEYAAGWYATTLDACNIDGVTHDGHWITVSGMEQYGLEIAHGGQIQNIPTDSNTDTLLPILSRRNAVSNVVVKRAPKRGMYISAQNCSFNNIDASGCGEYGIQVRSAGATLSFPGAATQLANHLSFSNVRAHYCGYNGMIIGGCDNIFIDDSCSFQNNGQNGSGIGAKHQAGILLFSSTTGGIGRVSIGNVNVSDTQTFSKTGDDGVSFEPGSTDADDQAEVSFIDSDGIDVGQYVTLVNIDGSDEIVKVLNFEAGNYTVQFSGAKTLTDSGNTEALTGTISSSGQTITGSGTALSTEIRSVAWIKSDGQYVKVVKAGSATTATVSPAPSPALSADTAELVVCDVTGIPSQPYGVYIDDVTGPIRVGRLVADNVSVRPVHWANAASGAPEQDVVLVGEAALGTGSASSGIIFGVPAGWIPILAKLEVTEAITGTDGTLTLRAFGSTTADAKTGIALTLGSKGSGWFYPQFPYTGTASIGVILQGGADNIASAGRVQIEAVVRKPPADLV